MSSSLLAGCHCAHWISPSSIPPHPQALPCITPSTEQLNLVMFWESVPGKAWYAQSAGHQDGAYWCSAPFCADCISCHAILTHVFATALKASLIISLGAHPFLICMHLCVFQEISHWQTTLFFKAKFLALNYIPKGSPKVSRKKETSKLYYTSQKCKVQVVRRPAVMGCWSVKKFRCWSLGFVRELCSLSNSL